MNIENTSDSVKGEAIKLYCASADLMSYSPKLSNEKVLGDNPVTWGDRNKLPDFLYELYENCTTLQSVINGITDYVYGAGVVNNTSFTGKNEFGDTLAKVVYKSELDTNIYGGCFIQVKQTLSGAISVAHIDARKCRLSKDEKIIFVHSYENGRKSSTVKYNRFDKSTLMKDGVQIYYYKGDCSRGTYPVCEYKSALASCETEIEATKFDYSNIKNGLTVQGVLNIAGDVPAEGRKQILDGVVDLYTGGNKAGRILTTFSGDSTSTSPVTFTPLTGNDADTRFINTIDRAVTNTFKAWRVNPIVFGLNVKTGFADQNFEEAYDLLYITHVVKKRQNRKTIFAEIFGDDNAIDFIDIQFGSTLKKAENEAEHDL